MRRMYMAALLTLSFVAVTASPALAQSTKPCPIPTATDLPFHPSYFTVDEPAAPNDPPPVPASYALRSDGKGQYGNGGTKRDFIVIDLNCTYHLYLNLLNTNTRSIPASLAATGSAPVQVNAHYIVVFRVATVPVTVAGTTLYGRFCAQEDTVVSVDPDGFVHDNYGGCGSDSYGSYVRRGVYLQAADADGVNWTAYFRTNLGFESSCLECGATAWVRVYHPDNGTWVLAPEGLPPEDPWQAAVFAPGTTRRSGDAFRGYSLLPFKITVVK